MPPRQRHDNQPASCFLKMVLADYDDYFSVVVAVIIADIARNCIGSLSVCIFARTTLSAVSYCRNFCL